MVQINGKWGFINTDGEYVINPQFDHARNFHEGLAKVTIGNGRGYVNRDGEIVINPIFDSAGDFGNGLGLVIDDDECGFISKDGQYIISGSEDDTVTIWRLADGEPIRTLAGHTIYVVSVAVSPDGQYIVSGSWEDNTVRLWKAQQ